MDGGGYGDLDWLLDQAAGAGRRVLLTLGMKAPGWPEFFIPDRLRPDARAGSDVAAASPALRAGALAFLASTVARYRGRTEVAAWQVENEPLNRSGPLRWWIGPEFLAEEILAVRDQDGTRPLALNVFCRFSWRLDAVSSRHGGRLARLLTAPGRPPEAETLAMLRPGDILGLDVYRRIASLSRGRVRVESARAWQANAGRWLGRAEREGRLAWVTEAQAEPWEPAGPAGRPSPGAPLTCGPDDLALIVDGLAAAGHMTILLWGAEHWLAREDAGDPAWVAAVRSLAGRRPLGA